MKRKETKNMKKVVIKRVKKIKKPITTKEKILTGLGIGTTILGGANMVSPKSAIVRSIKNTVKDAFSVRQAHASDNIKVNLTNNGTGAKDIGKDVFKLGATIFTGGAGGFVADKLSNAVLPGDAQRLNNWFFNDSVPGSATATITYFDNNGKKVTQTVTKDQYEMAVQLAVNQGFTLEQLGLKPPQSVSDKAKDAGKTAVTTAENTGKAISSGASKLSGFIFGNDVSGHNITDLKNFVENDKGKNFNILGDKNEVLVTLSKDQAQQLLSTMAEQGWVSFDSKGGMTVEDLKSIGNFMAALTGPTDVPGTASLQEVMAGEGWITVDKKTGAVKINDFDAVTNYLTTDPNFVHYEDARPFTPPPASSISQLFQSSPPSDMELPNITLPTTPAPNLNGIMNFGQQTLPPSSVQSSAPSAFEELPDLSGVNPFQNQVPNLSEFLGTQQAPPPQEGYNSGMSATRSMGSDNTGEPSTASTLSNNFTGDSNPWGEPPVEPGNAFELNTGRVNSSQNSGESQSLEPGFAQGSESASDTGMQGLFNGAKAIDGEGSYDPYASDPYAPGGIMAGDTAASTYEQVQTVSSPIDNTYVNPDGSSYSNPTGSQYQSAVNMVDGYLSSHPEVSDLGTTNGQGEPLYMVSNPDGSTSTVTLQELYEQANNYYSTPSYDVNPQSPTSFSANGTPLYTDPSGNLVDAQGTRYEDGGYGQPVPVGSNSTDSSTDFTSTNTTTPSVTESSDINEQDPDMPPPIPVIQPGQESGDPGNEVNGQINMFNQGQETPPPAPEFNENENWNIGNFGNENSGENNSNWNDLDTLANLPTTSHVNDFNFFGGSGGGSGDRDNKQYYSNYDSVNDDEFDGAYGDEEME